MSTSLMLQEAAQAPQVMHQQRLAEGDHLAALASQLRARPPALLMTLGRGSSAHAAEYLNYLVMQTLGVPSMLLPLSLLSAPRAGLSPSPPPEGALPLGSGPAFPLSQREAPLQVAQACALAISQSGQSPDLVAALAACRARGALSVALVNRVDSPLGREAAWTIDLCAGREHSVAATKSCLGAMHAGAWLLAHWAEDAALRDGLSALPPLLARVSQRGEQSADILGDWVGAERLLVVARGAALAAARELALKLKETCGLQAEAFSSAEVQHGPQTLVGEGYPVLMLAQSGASMQPMLDLAAAWRRRGARVLVVALDDVPEADWSIAGGGLDQRLAPLVMLQALYPAVASLALARGRDPDRPRFLSKVTCTE